VLGGRDGLELRTKKGPHGLEIAYDAVNHRSGERIDMPFTFVDVVNRAPMFVRRSAIRAIGGIDQVFAPFQCDDVDMCLRIWKAGGCVQNLSHFQ
jgi:GT2 family glycosyltransferase